MAHFAQLDANNTVIAVIVIDNANLLDASGVEQEQIGVELCKSLYGEDTNWKQTSYNARHGEGFRKNFAAIGGTYDEELDAFIGPKPLPSNVLDEETFTWKPPLPYPDTSKRYEWDEAAYQLDNSKGWRLEGPLNQYP